MSFPSLLSSVLLFAASSTASPRLRDTRNHVVDVALDGGFWFATFNAGASSNLSLLIDTGSGDMGINKGKYTPSSQAVNLNTSRGNLYGSTQSDGCGMARVDEDLYTDSVTVGGVTVQNQTLGSTTGGDPANFTVPHDGLVGFSAASNDSTSFLFALCQGKVVDECRFGLAFGETGQGKMILGSVDQDLQAGDLVKTPALFEWVVRADISANQNTVANSAVILLDSGTANVVGPIDIVQQIYNATGITGTMTSACGPPTLTGTFPCSSPPTGIGLSFSGSNSTGASQNQIFTIAGPSFANGDKGDGMCVSTLIGQDLPAPPSTQAKNIWVFGQSWFQGKYVDFDATSQMVGVTLLKNPSRP